MSTYVAVVVSIHWLVACWKWAGVDGKLDNLLAKDRQYLARLREKGL